MSNNTSKVGGGVLVGLLAIGGLIARNADNVFRFGGKAIRHGDDVGRRFADDAAGIGRHLDDAPDATRLADDLNLGHRMPDDTSSARLPVEGEPPEEGLRPKDVADGLLRAADVADAAGSALDEDD